MCDVHRCGHRGARAHALTLTLILALAQTLTLTLTLALTLTLNPTLTLTLTLTPTPTLTLTADPNPNPHQARVGTLCWSGHTLSSGSRDRLILQRDVRVAEHFTSKLSGHKQEVCGLLWSP